MKYLSEKQNARSKAEPFFRSGFAFVVFMAVLIVLSAFFIRENEAANENERNARRAITSAIEADMAKCVQLGRNMRYAGADIRGEILPALKIHLNSLKNLTDAYCESIKSAPPPVDRRFLSKTIYAMESLDRAYASGASSSDAEKALAAYLLEFENLLQTNAD